MDTPPKGELEVVNGGETAEHRQMRRIAFVAVVVSTVAVIAAVVTLPMLYSYVQSFQIHLLVETDYCKVSKLDENEIKLNEFDLSESCRLAAGLLKIVSITNNKNIKFKRYTTC